MVWADMLKQGADQIPDSENPMLSHAKRDGLGGRHAPGLYTDIDPKQAYMMASRPAHGSGGVSWKDMAGMVPAAGSVMDLARSVAGGVGDVADEISYQLKPVTLDDEAEYNKKQYNDPSYFNILVGGANAGGRGIFGLSSLPFGVLAKGVNRKLFRNGDIEGIRKGIAEALEGGKKVRVFGHSWGGADVARLASEYPDIPFYALDPVSWTGRIKHTPKNLAIVRPRDPSLFGGHENLAGWLAATLGGRWPDDYDGEGTIWRYTGGHANGLSQTVNHIIHKQWADDALAAKGYDERYYGVPFKEWKRKVFRTVYPK